MKYILVFGFLIFILIACKEEKKKDTVAPKWTTENSTELNKAFSREEEIEIRIFLEHRKDWDFKKSGTGLRYWIYEDKEGPTAKADDRVDVKYEFRMLNDSLIYKTEKGEVSSFKVNKSDIESGIMEGVKYMSEGDKAKLIIPSHIGHGLLGDFNKIPPLEVLLVDLELIKIY